MSDDLFARAGHLAGVAAQRLRDAGLLDEEILTVLGRRLGVPILPAPEPPADLWAVPVGGVLNGRAVGRWRRDPDGPNGETRGTLLEGPSDPAAGRPAGVEQVTWPVMAEAGRPAGAPVTLVPPLEEPVMDEAGEPPVGSVVTDTRQRVHWRDEQGWHRAGAAEVSITWRDVCQANGGPEQQPRPGQPTVVSQPPQRAQGPTVVRPAGVLELPVQVPVLGPDGEPLLGPDGRKLLRTETETMTISEVVPAGGQQ